VTLVLCVDFGSTFTKAAVVDTANGRLIATANHPTTLETDVLDGLVLRHHDASDARAVLSTAIGDHVEGGWLVPRAPRVVIDRAYVLAAAGLLARDYPEAAYALLFDHLVR
jgi:hypothetical protein